MTQKRLTIIGAGPIGLEAALYATQLGFDVEVLERDRVGSNLERWGHVRLFSPWEMNHSSLGVKLLRQHDNQWGEPGPGTMMTGAEFVKTYLGPLSQLPQLANRVKTGVSVQSVGRSSVLKNELIGNPERANFPFRILTQSHDGSEAIRETDYLLDASGVYGNHNWLGEGGIPAPGEVAAEAHIDYELSDLVGKDRARFLGKRTLLVGAGYSAATTVSDFQTLIAEDATTSLLWTVRDGRIHPIPVIEDDALAYRSSLTAAANTIAIMPTKGIEFRNNTTVTAVEYRATSNTFIVSLARGGEFSKIEVDRIIANVGFGPDNSIYRELQVHECWASRGPMKLSAALLGASSGSTDCLGQGSMGPETLRNPEPNFFILGNKSYGRNPTFLLRIGLSQVVEVFSLIMDDAALNLYQGEHEDMAA